MGMKNEIVFTQSERTQRRLPSSVSIFSIIFTEWVLAGFSSVINIHLHFHPLRMYLFCIKHSQHTFFLVLYAWEFPSKSVIPGDNKKII